MPNVSKKTDKKTVPNKKTSSNKKVFDCDDVEQYLDRAVQGVKNEILPRIELLDRRDKEQYESAKKIIIDANDLMSSRQKHSEKIVESVKQEIDGMIEKQEEVIKKFQNSLTSLHEKFDVHISDESTTFTLIKESLKDISDHGTKLAQQIAQNLNNIKVNGGTYPLSDALQYIYAQHTETHQKLDEVVALVEPIRVRKKWMRSTYELIHKNGLLNFLFTSKLGMVLLIIVLLLIVNSILLDVFGIKLDLKSIFIWLSSLGSKGG